MPANDTERETKSAGGTSTTIRPPDADATATHPTAPDDDTETDSLVTLAVRHGTRWTKYQLTAGEGMILTDESGEQLASIDVHPANES